MSRDAPEKEQEEDEEEEVDAEKCDTNISNASKLKNKINKQPLSIICFSSGVKKMKKKASSALCC